MALRWATLFICVLACSANVTPAQAADSVKLFDETHHAVSGADANGVLTWWSHQKYEAVGGASVSLGSLDSGTTAQLVSFTVGHPPALKLGVTWSPTTDVVELVYVPVYTIPIKIWVLCAQAQCDHGITASKRAKLDGFLLWANKRLTKERVGIRIVAVDDDPSNPDEWISDQTASTAAAAAIPLDFDPGSGNGKDGDCPKLRSVPPELKRPGAFNVYMVDTVDGEPSIGDSCHTDDSAVVGRTASQGTILHELCHDLSLEHSDSMANVGGEKNLMHSESSSRLYLTEGQVFRVHFSTRSGLNGSLSGNRPPGTAPLPEALRDCENAPDLDCPAEETRLWPGW